MQVPRSSIRLHSERLLRIMVWSRQILNCWWSLLWERLCLHTARCIHKRQQVSSWQSLPSKDTRWQIIFRCRYSNPIRRRRSFQRIFQCFCTKCRLHNHHDGQSQRRRVLCGIWLRNKHHWLQLLRALHVKNRHHVRLTLAVLDLRSEQTWS